MRSFPIQHQLPGASRLVLGCMGFGGGWGDEPLTEGLVGQAQATVEAALVAGITLFDHADIYTRGKAESAFGELFRRQPSLRGRLMLQSKCGIRFGDGERPGRYELSSAYIERSVEASLRRLHSDQLDLLLLHRPDALFEPEEIAKAFTRLRESGKVAFFGVSNFHAAQLAWLQSALPMPLAANQLQMSLLHAHWLEAGACFNDAQQAGSLPWIGTLEHCQRERIQLQAWGPLDRGWLCGAAPADAPATVQATATLVAKLAERYGVAPEAIVIAWLLRHPAGIQPVIGTTAPARIQACTQALQIELSRDDWYALWVSARGRPLP
jgi:predicted oxidoreductase